MKKESIKAFIEYGVNRELTAKQLRNMAFGLSIFYGIGILYGFMMGGTELILGKAILIITKFFTIYILFKSRTKKLTLKNFCVLAGVTSLEATINFLLITLIICQMLGVKMWINVVVLLVPLFIMTVYFIITYNRIRNGAFLNKGELKRKNLYLFSSLGGVVGIAIARTYLSNVGQSTALLIVVIGFLALSTIFSVANINFLKLYYIEKVFKNDIY